MDTRPFEALCSQIIEEIGPWCSTTPEGRRKDLEQEATAREAPFTLQGVEVLTRSTSPSLPLACGVSSGRRTAPRLRRKVLGKPPSRH